MTPLSIPSKGRLGYLIHSFRYVLCRGFGKTIGRRRPNPSWGPRVGVPDFRTPLSTTECVFAFCGHLRNTPRIRRSQTPLSRQSSVFLSLSTLLLCRFEVRQSDGDSPSTLCGENGQFNVSTLPSTFRVVVYDVTYVQSIGHRVEREVFLPQNGTD